MLWISGLIFFVACLYISMKDLVKEKSHTIIIKRIFALSSSYRLSVCTSEIVHSHPVAHFPYSVPEAGDVL